MLWITHKRYTPEFYTAKLETMHRDVRCSTRCMALIALGAGTVQLLLNMTYTLCL